MAFPRSLAMTPAGPLTLEHRLIESMVELLEKACFSLRRQEAIAAGFFDSALDFITMYADACHHGKEEDIFFTALLTKKLRAPDKKIIRELIDEHTQARARVRIFSRQCTQYAANTSGVAKDITASLEWLIQFYPAHIQKEDACFCSLCVDYLSDDEQDAILQQFCERDTPGIHTKYSKLLEKMQAGSE